MYYDIIDDLSGQVCYDIDDLSGVMTLIDDISGQVRLNLISVQSDEKLKTVLLNLHQSLAAKVCYARSYWM